MLIGRVEKRIGFPSQQHIQRVTTKICGNNYIQKGETLEHGVVRYKEIILKGWDKFVRACASFDKDGEYIKNSRFVERVDGPEANNKPVYPFGLIC